MLNEIDRRKVVVLLIDGFREDFIHWGCLHDPSDIENYQNKCKSVDAIDPDKIVYLDHKRSKYKGKKMTLLSRLAHDEP
jgi:predicted AlkP superfamily pyrophosphatase or phosphodiesterase